MQDSGYWYPPSVALAVFLPTEGPFLAPSSEYLVPQSENSLPKTVHCREIAGNGEVSVVACYYLM